MGRHSPDDDEGGGDSRGCFHFLSVWFPGLRSPSERRAAQEASSRSSRGSSYSSGTSGSSTGSAGSSESKSASLNSFDDGDSRSSHNASDSSSSSSPTSTSSSHASWNNLGEFTSSSDSADLEAASAESDPQERARRAAESFMQWKDKEYVPLSADEKRAIKEYRKTVAQEQGTYMSSRAQRPRPGGQKRHNSREGEAVNLNSPAAGGRLMRRRSSKIRFTAAVVASKATDVHNDAVVVTTEEGEEVPALPRSASILRKSSLRDVSAEPPVFMEDIEHTPSDLEDYGFESTR